MSHENSKLDSALQEQILTVTRCGLSAGEATDFFRLALGLCYLATLMTKETLDFKKLDKAFNRFIYRSIGPGHSITSILQWMSGEGVVAVLDSKRFTRAFGEYLPHVPVESIPFLLGLNLGVAKDFSGLDVRGPVADWIERQRIMREGA
ncbi:hypothetical protein [Pseudoduganella albidiflava]|uniref:Uncharacterized protein n=1 Tax=Pseudoduganella albidiflava TaxID=321983 RepID=A0A411X427_9BURK|nr:hypothetical protein [Pseudoduganella albidiflava]QBI03643.1 hypothetical protein EYF70_24525 [Pseudoduganella albidiflava]GGY51624.1 hypothetical protein GCM10007387_37590 [Pseudoduganella albidiflava]